MRPIRVGWSELSQKFYAFQSYNIKDGVMVVTGKKYDVTQDIAAAIHEHGVSFTCIKERSVKKRA